MGNRDKAKELREKHVEVDAVQTKEALASEGEVAKASDAVVKSQEELENVLLLNKELEIEKEDLESENEDLRKQTIQLEAMLETSKAELATAKKEVTALKTKVTKLEKA